MRRTNLVQGVKVDRLDLHFVFSHLVDLNGKTLSIGSSIVQFKYGKYTFCGPIPDHPILRKGVK